MGMFWLLALAVTLLLGGWLTYKRSTQLHQQTGLPTGRLIYADTSSHEWRRPVQPLYSELHNLSGKPDYLVETDRGLIPVEVKSGPAPPVPYLGHLLQVAAYCLLVEATTGCTPPHGLLKYADALYEIDFTPELRQELLSVLTEVRQARLADNVPRSHQQPNKCAACGVRYACDEALGTILFK
jgi:CRISPR-associated exonuclease Cas4